MRPFGLFIFFTASAASVASVAPAASVASDAPAAAAAVDAAAAVEATAAAGAAEAAEASEGALQYLPGAGIGTGRCAPVVSIHSHRIQHFCTDYLRYCIKQLVKKPTKSFYCPVEMC